MMREKLGKGVGPGGEGWVGGNHCSKYSDVGQERGRTWCSCDVWWKAVLVPRALNALSFAQ